MSDFVGASAADSLPTGEPAVIARLPAGVEYTHVKQIVLGLPGALDVFPWFTSPQGSEVDLRRFRGKTFRALDRALHREEQRVLAVQAERGSKTQVTAMLRHQFIGYFRLALQQWDPNRRKRWLSTGFVAPSQSDSAAPPTDLSRRDLVIEVWEQAKHGPRLLDRVVMPPGPPPWGDVRVAYYDSWLADRLCAEVCRRHFREVMRRRIGQDWWSERPSATGWPMLTRYAIPMLYDYLHPFYPVRTYRKDRVELTSGHYPRQLFLDIKDILQEEVPHLAADLKEAQVQAVVQRYLQNAPDDRPRGFDMFGVRLNTGTA